MACIRGIGEVDVSPATAELKVELKVCELCGALWMRAQGSRETLCRRCAVLPRPGAQSKLPARPGGGKR